MLIEFDNTVALVKPDNEGEAEIYGQVRDKLKTAVPSARYMYQHKLWLRTKVKQGWDGKTSILSKPHPGNRSAFFPAGLMPMVNGELRVRISGVIRFKDLRVVPPGVDMNPTYTVPLRDYQQNAIAQAISNVVIMGERLERMANGEDVKDKITNDVKQIVKTKQYRILREATDE